MLLFSSHTHECKTVLWIGRFYVSTRDKQAETSWKTSGFSWEYFVRTLYLETFFHRVDLFYRSRQLPEYTFQIEGYCTSTNRYESNACENLTWSEKACFLCAISRRSQRTFTSFVSRQELNRLELWGSFIAWVLSFPYFDAKCIFYFVQRFDCQADHKPVCVEIRKMSLRMQQITSFHLPVIFVFDWVQVTWVSTNSHVSHLIIRITASGVK